MELHSTDWTLESHWSENKGRKQIWQNKGYLIFIDSTLVHTWSPIRGNDPGVIRWKRYEIKSQDGFKSIQVLFHR